MIAHNSFDNNSNKADALIQIPINSSINDNNKRSTITNNSNIIKKKKRTIPVVILRQMLTKNKMMN